MQIFLSHNETYIFNSLLGEECNWCGCAVWWGDVMIKRIIVMRIRSNPKGHKAKCEFCTESACESEMSLSGSV